MGNQGAIHHLDLNASDLKRSARFYDRLLTFIGFRAINLTAPGEPDGFDWVAPAGSGSRLTIGLYPARVRGPHNLHASGIHHLALKAGSRAAVDELYSELCAMSAEILAEPREYPQYEPGYYAVFFLDPDGIKLEYVFTPGGD